MLLNRKNTDIETKLPIKVVQFGEGNFLRAFVDYAFQKLNKKIGFNAGVAVVQPIESGLVHLLNEQEGLYTLFLKGVKKGQEVENKELIENIVKAVNPYEDFEEYLNLAREEELEFIISNTTEAGIAYAETDQLSMQPPASFPAKLCLLLHERFRHFKGDASKGLTIIPCELINYNADALKDILLKYIEKWGLEKEFRYWLLEYNYFHNTLVDRIVPGYPKEQIEDYNKQLDYKDKLIVSAETFFLWVIEGDERLKAKLPFEKVGLDVKIVKDMQPYRTRKVRILNGAHTVMVPMSLLYGNETVRQTVDNGFTGTFVRDVVFEEIIPTLEMDREELTGFAEEVFDRFRNPFIKHNLSSIALNSISKFKVRVLPSLLDYYEKYDKLPMRLTFAFACLIRFYKGEWKGTQLPVNDNNEIVQFFEKFWKLNDYHALVNSVLANTNFWEKDLSQIKELPTALVLALNEIEMNGIEQGFINFARSFA